MSLHHHASRVLACAAAIALSSCVLAPRGARDERARLDTAGTAYETPSADRALPALPSTPGWRDVLRHAFLANGDLEAAYFSWKAALERIGSAAAYPNTPVTLSFSYLFSDDKLKGWDRTTLALAPDAMLDLAFPTKVMAAGRVAFADAQEAGRRFEAAKFDLQQRVLVAWHAWALAAERTRLAEEERAILATSVASRTAAVGAGMTTGDLANAEADLALADEAIARAEADIVATRADLLAAAGLPAHTHIEPPSALDPPRVFAADDATLLAHATTHHPTIAAADAMIASRIEAIGAAKQQFIPDINPLVGIEGSMGQIAGMMIAIPARVTYILGVLREADAARRRAEAMRRQLGVDREAALVATLAALRADERASTLVADRVLPATAQAVASAMAGYEAGVLPWSTVTMAQRARIAARRTLADARVAREQRLAELEALAAIDVEVLS